VDEVVIRLVEVVRLVDCNGEHTIAVEFYLADGTRMAGVRIVCIHVVLASLQVKQILAAVILAEEHHVLVALDLADLARKHKVHLEFDELVQHVDLDEVGVGVQVVELHAHQVDLVHNLHECVVNEVAEPGDVALRLVQTQLQVLGRGELRGDHVARGLGAHQIQLGLVFALVELLSLGNETESTFTVTLSLTRVVL